MSERLEIREFQPGIDLYTVYDERVNRSAVAGWYEVVTHTFHKFANSTRWLQRKVDGKWLRGFGVQENVFVELKRQGCQNVRVHYAPIQVMYTSPMTLWGERGLLANYSGLQRFLGILDLDTTRKQVAAERRGALLSPEKLEAGRQMQHEPDLIPEWFVAEEAQA